MERLPAKRQRIGLGQRLRRTRSLALALCAVSALFCGFLAASASAKNLGEWNQGDVDSGIAKGVTYLDSVSDKSDPSKIHWPGGGNSGDVTDTGFALAAIGAALQANPANVTAGQLANARNAVQWLITQQDTGNTDQRGSFGISSGSSGSNYATSIALMALSFFSSEPGAANAIDLGRAFEVRWQNASSAATGNPGSGCTPPSGGFYGNCGSWSYNPAGNSGGDGSNTGFAVTGLDFSGGVPAGTAQANLEWARASQELNSNPYATLNDGGGSYQPGETYQPFRSSANGTGTILFSFAYDGLPANDAGVQAAMKLGTDILDVYELSKGSSRAAIYHDPPDPPGDEDGTCQIGVPNCDWLVTGDGGYHYSLFALSKGMGSYIAPDVTAPGNFYAKVADLLLGEQTGDGSWPADLRDDGSTVGGSSFSILALAKAGQKKNPASISGVKFNDHNGNGKRDSGDEGLQGWTVYLDANGNSAHDQGEPSAVTGAGGAYTIGGVDPGDYPALREVSQAAFTCTAPAGCAYTNVSLASGQAATGFDFGNRKVVTVPRQPQLCKDKRKFRFFIHQPRKDSVTRVVVSVDGKVVKQVRGKRIRKVAIKRQKRGQFTLRIDVYTRRGQHNVSIRKYNKCKKGAPNTKVHRPPRH